MFIKAFKSIHNFKLSSCKRQVFCIVYQMPKVNNTSFFLAVFLCVCLSTIYGQINYILPIDPPVDISASYGEARPNHFHAGIDFATGGKFLPLKSIADGYVERLRVGPGGYGNAIYIRHPDGNISVYGHLDRFLGGIAEKAKEIQRKKQFFEFDEYFQPDELPVNQGQIIAYTGNSGSSTGAHLHFEIRGPGFETAMNPLRFGFSIKDQLKPVISAIHIIPYKQFGKVNGKQEALRIPVNNGILAYKESHINVEGWVVIAYEGYDGITKAGSRSLAYKTQVFQNETLIFEKAMDAFGFDDSRCVNAFLNYADLVKLKRKVYNCFEPANHNSPIYKKTVNKGLIHFSQVAEHHFQLKLTDFAGNSSSVKFKLKAQPLKTGGDAKASKGIAAGAEQVFKFEGGSLFLPTFALFDTTLIAVKKTGNIFEIGNPNIPINESITLNLKLAPEQMSWDSAKIVLKLQSGATTKYLLGSFSDGFFKTKINLFGKFQLITDTVAPIVQFQRPKKQAATVLPSATGKANFKVSESISGIGYYTAFINEEWTLLAYDSKLGMMWLVFDPKLPKGTHDVRVEVSDKAGNKTVLKQKFVK